MYRETIRDTRHGVLGYLETLANGKQQARDKSFYLLGYYDPKRDITQDANYDIIANGNVLSGLILNQPSEQVRS
jgi:hypothetical protein